MKRFFSIIAMLSLALVISASANAQVKLGVKAGVDMTTLSGDFNADFKNVLTNYTGFHAGLALKIGLPLGLAIQPEVLYTQEGITVDKDLDLDFLDDLGVIGDLNLNHSLVVGSIQVPVALQWGISLGPVRPFIQAVPYISIPVSHVFKVTSNTNNEKTKLDNDLFNTLDYGVGLGAGIELFKMIQVSAKYNWALGTMIDPDLDKASTLLENLGWKDTFKKSNISGLQISAAIFF